MVWFTAVTWPAAGRLRSAPRRCPWPRPGAGLDRGRVAERNGLQAGRALQLDHGDVAGHVVPDDLGLVGACRLAVVAVIEVEPSMTWLLVSTRPSELITMPVPAACSLLYCSVVLMMTRPGCDLVDDGLLARADAGAAAARRGIAALGGGAGAACARWARRRGGCCRPGGTGPPPSPRPARPRPARPAGSSAAHPAPGRPGRHRGHGRWSARRAADRSRCNPASATASGPGPDFTPVSTTKLINS